MDERSKAGWRAVALTALPVVLLVAWVIAIWKIGVMAFVVVFFCLCAAFIGRVIWAVMGDAYDNGVNEYDRKQREAEKKEGQTP